MARAKQLRQTTSIVHNTDQLRGTLCSSVVPFHFHILKSGREDAVLDCTVVTYQGLESALLCLDMSHLLKTM